MRYRTEASRPLIAGRSSASTRSTAKLSGVPPVATASAMRSRGSGSLSRMVTVPSSRAAAAHRAGAASAPPESHLTQMGTASSCSSRLSSTMASRAGRLNDSAPAGAEPRPCDP